MAVTHGGMDGRRQPRYLCLRLCLVAISTATVGTAVISLIPWATIGEETLFSHTASESLFPVSQTAWIVHEVLLAGIADESIKIAPSSPTARSGLQALTTADGRRSLCTLDTLHYLMVSVGFAFCVLHCWVIRSYPTMFFMAVTSVCFLMPILFIRDVRAALRWHHAESGRPADRLATNAIQRGVAMLGAMAFLLTENAACLGATTSTQYRREHCPFTLINILASITIASVHLFEVLIIDTGVASHHEILQCRSDTPRIVRGSAGALGVCAVTALLMWAARHSIPVYVRSEPSGLFVQNQPVVVAAALPLFVWTCCYVTLFARLSSLVRQRQRRASAMLPLHEADEASGAAAPGVAAPAPAARAAEGGADVLSMAALVG